MNRHISKNITLLQPALGYPSLHLMKCAFKHLFGTFERPLRFSCTSTVYYQTIDHIHMKSTFWTEQASRSTRNSAWMTYLTLCSFSTSVCLTQWNMAHTSVLWYCSRAWKFKTTCIPFPLENGSTIGGRLSPLPMIHLNSISKVMEWCS